MILELAHVTDLLEKRGLKEGDDIIIKPFHGRQRSMMLNRTELDFISSNMRKRTIGTNRVLDSIQGETFHVALSQVETESRTKEKHKRFLLKSITGGPFKLNGNFVMESFVEVGDICEIGFNRLEFERKKDPNKQFEIDDFEALNENNLLVSDIPILLEGETGVGKTTIAKKIHDNSRPYGTFVHVNLSAFSTSLLESELFGHVKGAFTGAINAKKGALMESNGGTLFLDEIDSLPLDIQTKLLLFLDSKIVRPVGGEVSHKVDTRIICASGKSLESCVKQEKMRMDFYYRIASGACIVLPPLRDCPDKIRKICDLFSIDNDVVISEKLIEFYQSLPWPGNIRQLAGYLKRKKVFTKTRKFGFDKYDSELMQKSSELYSINDEVENLTMEELKSKYAKKIYDLCNRNATRAAMKLNISTKVLRRLILDDSA